VLQWYLSPRLQVAIVFGLLSISASTAAGQTSALDRSLIAEVRKGNTESVARLLKEGADPNAVDDAGNSALHFASRFEHLKTLQLLIRHGADVNAIDQTGRSVLTDAIGAKDARVPMTLIESGATPDDGAVAQACWLGGEKILDHILDAGGNPSAGMGMGALGGHVDILKKLLDRGANVDAKSGGGGTALHSGAQQGGLETVQFLLERGANPHVASDTGDTPLHCAIRSRNDLKVIQLLVQAGAKLDAANQEGITPLRLAAVSGPQAHYDWLLAANGGQESPVRRQKGEVTPETGKSNPELIKDYLSGIAKVQIPAQRELAIRGKEAMPDVLASIDAGTGIERLYDLFSAMGPGAEAALPKLEQALADKQLVLIAINSMQHIRPGYFSSLSLETRQVAAGALYEGLRDLQLGALTRYYVRALAATGDAAPPYVLMLLRSNDLQHRAHGERIVIAIQPGEEIIDELLKIFRDKDKPDRFVAGNLLVDLQHSQEEVRTELLKIVKQPPPFEGRDLTEAQRKVDGEWSKNAERAAFSLAKFGPGIIDELIPLLTPLEAPRRSAAMTAIIEIGGPAVPRLIELLSHEDLAIAISASVSLNRIGQPAVLALAQAVGRPNDQVTAQAASALWRIGVAPEAVPALLEVTGSTERSDIARLAAVHTALHIDPINSRQSEAVLSAIPMLIRFLDGADFQHRGWAAEALRDIGPAAREALPTLRKSSHPTFKHAVRVIEEGLAEQAEMSP
jgi:ankyrin repeat protein/HEAT repeat protein